MRLWQQGWVLIGLPLLFQVIFASLLIVHVKQIDFVISRETDSKRVLSICRELRSIVDRFTMNELAKAYMSPATTTNAKQAEVQELTKQLKMLDSLSQIDDQSKDIIRQFRQHLLELSELISHSETEVSGGQPTVALSRFDSQSEYFEEIVIALATLARDEKQIKAHFAPIAKEFSPEALEGRQHLISWIVAGIIFNIALAAGLAIFYGKKTLARFAVLTDNIKRFSEGTEQLQLLKGNDELADVGHSFQEMAEARLKAEDLRNTLLAMVSHDLRSPLSSCTISLSVLVEKQPESMSLTALRQIRRVNAELLRLVRMADSLLTVGKGEHEKIDMILAPVMIDDLIGPTLNAVRGIADTKDVCIELDLDPQRSLLCDADKVIQILVNLVSNSLKFAPRASTIVIKAYRSQDLIRFEITDQGPGVPEDLKHKLFQKFTQLDQPAEIKSMGSGLGLYISKLLVSAHGGEIGCSSSTDGGACFWFELPQPVISSDLEE